MIGKSSVPLNNSVVELLKKDYVPVIKDNHTSYGGSQMWFPKNNWYSKDYILHNYGCGTIATADMLLYLALQKESMQNRDTEIALQSSNQIKYENYIPYVYQIHNQYTKTHRYLAVLGTKVANAINSYSDIHGLGLNANWKWKLTYYDMIDIIEEMLEHDIPVILAIGPNTPNLWSKKGIPFYERKEIEYKDSIDEKETTEEKETAEEKRKPYYYQVVEDNVTGHYVTVTGIMKDDVAGRIILHISSWGKQYYINYEEYRDYIDNYSGTYTSSIVQIRKDGLSFYFK